MARPRKPRPVSACPYERTFTMVNARAGRVRRRPGTLVKSGLGFAGKGPARGVGNSTGRCISLRGGAASNLGTVGTAPPSGDSRPMETLSPRAPGGKPGGPIAIRPDPARGRRGAG